MTCIVKVYMDEAGRWMTIRPELSPNDESDTLKIQLSSTQYDELVHFENEIYTEDY